ncbi:MAG: HsdM family class I SAM-dependent methyltransferase [Nitrospirota bacterium]
MNIEKINQLDRWKYELGLLPVPLYDRQQSEEKYILLNGSQGNFCLDLTGMVDPFTFRNLAWSADVGHYVSLIGENIELYRWDRTETTIERYTKKSIDNNLEKFHSYLEKNQPGREFSIVPHVINTFRSIRNALGNNVNGAQALKAFLYLLACATENVDRKSLSLNRWNLDQEALSIAETIHEADWTSYVEELKLGRRMNRLVPDLSLVLRHASGQLFQEAHYEALFPNQAQLRFAGILPSPIALGNKDKSAGVHFTPPALARTLVEAALDSIKPFPNSLVIFDPACGSAEFLREVLRQLKLQKYTGSVKLIGWDISLSAIDMAKFVLAWEMKDWGSKVQLDLRHKDALDKKKPWPQNVDIILMNPPFLSWQDMSQDQRETVKATLGNLSQKRPDLASAFVWQAAQSLRNGGVMGNILPASLLDGESASKLRGEVSSILSPKLIARLGSHLIFTKAMVDAGLYVGKREQQKDISATALWADHQLSSTTGVLRAFRKYRYLGSKSSFILDNTSFCVYLNPEIGKNEDSWAPRPFKSWSLFQQLKQFSTVKDTFSVQQGVLTGLNSAFIISKDYFHSLPRGEQKFFRPAVLNESIKDGRLSDVAYIFYPYDSETPEINSEVSLKKHLKTYYNDILRNKKQMLLQRARVKENSWWHLSEHRAWQEEKRARIISTYFGNAGSFAWDKSGKYVVVQGYSWSPKLSKNQSLIPEKVWLAYIAILSSPLVDELLSAVSNHTGGGQWNLSKRFIEKMPLPNLMIESVDIDILKELSRIGSSINSGKEFNREILNELASVIYGVEPRTF